MSPSLRCDFVACNEDIAVRSSGIVAEDRGGRGRGSAGPHLQYIRRPLSHESSGANKCEWSGHIDSARPPCRAKRGQTGESRWVVRGAFGASSQAEVHCDCALTGKQR